MLRAAVGAAGALAVLSVVILSSGQGRHSVSLMGRSDDLAGKMGMPAPMWGSGHAPASLSDNFGGNNMKIAEIIKGLHATTNQPNLAAALHGLEKSVQSAANSLEDLQQPASLGAHTPVFPDPKGFVSRIQRMRAHSHYCRAHPTACKNLSGQADEASEFPPVQEKAKGRTMALYGGDLVSGQDAAAWLPHAATDDGDMARTSFEDAPPRDAANPALAPSLDPMWCGASHCADQGFARGQMMFKQKRLASTQALASYPGGRTFAGHGDSLIPHGRLWGVGKPGIVRYHEYKSPADFYKSSVADRAVVEPEKQVQADAYQLESKELKSWGKHWRGLMNKRAFNKNYAAGAAMFNVAKSPADSGLKELVHLQQRQSHEGALPAAARSVPKMRGVSMSVVAAERAGSQLSQEEAYQRKQQAQLSRLFANLKA